MVYPNSNRANFGVSAIPAHPDAGFFLDAAGFNPPSPEGMDQDIL
jgi:hypothetical protein